MTDLLARLEQCLRGRTCLLGVGNVDSGDDGVGVRLAEELRATGVPGVIVGTAPEQCARYLDGTYSHLVFLDAVDFGGEPGSVVWLDAREMAARFPQVSTHNIALGALAQMVESSGSTKAWLLGVQPQCLQAESRLTPVVEQTVAALVELLCRFRPADDPEHRPAKANV